MNRKRQGGFSIISAIFLIVVLAALVAYMVSVATVQHQSDALAVHSARGYQAALAGLEAAAYREIAAGVDGDCDAGGPLNLSMGGNIAFTVTLSCVSIAQLREGPNLFESYVLLATAQAGTYGQPDFVSREARMTVVVGP